MRIVGGRWRGRSLKGPSSDAIRPTSDRLRETLFNILQHGYDDPIEGARVLDAYLVSDETGQSFVDRLTIGQHVFGSASGAPSHV